MNDTALIVIDAQKIYTDADSDLYCADSKRTIHKINELIYAFDNAELPVIFVRHVHKRDGSDAGRLFDFDGEQEEVNFLEDTPYIEYDERLNLNVSKSHHIVKNRYSAFAGTGLHALLTEMAMTRVVICGFMTNFCCDSTARSALDFDYYVDVVIDATGTPGTDELSEKKIRKVIAQLLSAGFARIFDTKSFIGKM